MTIFLILYVYCFYCYFVKLLPFTYLTHIYRIVLRISFPILESHFVKFEPLSKLIGRFFLRLPITNPFLFYTELNVNYLLYFVHLTK